MHGGKIQVVVSSNGRLMHVSQLTPGRRHDSYLFRISGFTEFIKTTTTEHGKRETRHPYILGDSGYVGLQDIYPELIVGKKKPKNGEPTREELDWNKRMHSDRTIVENFFFFFLIKFGLFERPYRCALNTLQDIVVTCVCLPNMNLKRHPLRTERIQQEATSESSSSSFDEPPSKMSPKKDDSNIPNC